MEEESEWKTPPTASDITHLLIVQVNQLADAPIDNY